MRALFKERAATATGRALYAAAVAQARQPAFYTAGVADSYEGRFELYTLHTVLLLHRLRGEGPVAADVNQALFDAFVRGLDDGLRDMGVGDLSVGKKMRKLGEAFYGRAKSYDGALEALPDVSSLEALLGRTVLQDGDAALAPALARYVVATTAALDAQPLEALLRGEVRWEGFAP